MRARLRTTLFALGWAFAVAACDETDDDTGDSAGPHGGKADHDTDDSSSEPKPWSSCEGHCGENQPNGCSCDVNPASETYCAWDPHGGPDNPDASPCCVDAQAVCTAPMGTCMGRCGKADGECRCDASCFDSPQGCCPDVIGCCVDATNEPCG